ncbi:MAG: HPr family phosphocarrier protein [Actinomycetes bacterium]|jgi:phosphocarrier protein HPr
MKEFRTTVASAVGLHARPAALFASSAKSSGCSVRLAKVLPTGELSPDIDGASVLRVMTLGVKFGDEIVVRVEGPEEDSVAAALKVIVESADH